MISVSVCVCVCVCLSAFDHISGTTCPIFTIFFCMLPMAVARSSSDGMLRISCFVDDVIFAQANWLLDVAARLRRRGSHVRRLGLGA